MIHVIDLPAEPHQYRQTLIKRDDKKLLVSTIERLDEPGTYETAVLQFVDDEGVLQKHESDCVIYAKTTKNKEDLFLMHMDAEVDAILKLSDGVY